MLAHGESLRRDQFVDDRDELVMRLERRILFGVFVVSTFSKGLNGGLKSSNGGLELDAFMIASDVVTAIMHLPQAFAQHVPCSAKPLATTVR